MKIGILTYHRSHNYGALLQAIALRKVLADMGHEVTFIDYWPAYHRHMYALFSFASLKYRSVRGNLSYIKSCLQNYKYRKERINNFNKFIAEYIEPFLSSMNDSYDLVIHGSDQIWRKQFELRTYNPVYFGNHNIQTVKKISYAASMGILPENKADKLTVRKLLSNLDTISVREHGLKELCISLGYAETRQDLDPTLLLNLSDWAGMFRLRKKDNAEKYALYYKIIDSFDICELQRFSVSKGLNLKIIYHEAGCMNSDEHITTADPCQFLYLMYNADFVFTSSFHGLVFALLFHKPFFASFTRNSGRAASLLDALEIQGRLLNSKGEIPSNIQPINYNMVDNTLNQLRSSSRDFLFNQGID